MFLRKALVIQKLEEAEVKKFVGHRFPEFSFSRIEVFGKRKMITQTQQFSITQKSFFA